MRAGGWTDVAAVSAGGVVGAEARYAVGELLPHAAGEVPWSTVVVNVSGCFLIGVLMAVLAVLSRRARPPRVARPFLGVGVLGGYTTFSTYALEAHQLAAAGRLAVALTYAVGALAAALAAVWAGTALTRRALR
ncbi:fluoride efflux transporter CrcB [Motilibacter sp. E257]|uniref:Fluoride-specific ion channel FluC n=1 Tax=Motilibacter deserti TaxID=2714956 RepID=A0ABX0GQ94_9ACTN|nr:fluoride efflux transporter CrcB [Motilibacter deserti]